MKTKLFLTCCVLLQVAKKTWNHLECPICTLLEEDIKRAWKDHELKKKLEAELEDHWSFQEEFREHYARTITKGVENAEKGDLVIHIDGGTAGSEYSPYYFQDITDEPVPHSCMKVKNTFVQIHGWGVIVFQTYSAIEDMSSNHVIEVYVVRSIIFYPGLKLFVMFAISDRLPNRLAVLTENWVIQVAESVCTVRQHCY